MCTVWVGEDMIALPSPFSFFFAETQCGLRRFSGTHSQPNPTYCAQRSAHTCHPGLPCRQTISHAHFLYSYFDRKGENKNLCTPQHIFLYLSLTSPNPSSLLFFPQRGALSRGAQNVRYKSVRQRILSAPLFLSLPPLR